MQIYTDQEAKLLKLFISVIFCIASKLVYYQKHLAIGSIKQIMELILFYKMNFCYSVLGDSSTGISSTGASILSTSSSAFAPSTTIL